MLFQKQNPGRLAPPPALAGKKLWVPRLQVGGSRLLAAAFRSIGIDAEVLPPSDERTRELGARHSCGDECYPLKLTLGDCLKILEQPGKDKTNTAFLVATGQGPCRFGQYAPYFQSVFGSLGYPDITLVSPSFENGYADYGESSSLFVRSAWRAIVSADILLKLLLRTRPYEITPDSADALYDESLTDLSRILETRHRSYARQMDELQAGLLRARARFRALPLHKDRNRPLIGVVGEIFCRLNTFSNEDLARRLEAAGAEVWMNDVSEWLWYTNDEEARQFARKGKTYSASALRAKLRNIFQKRDEHALVSLFREDFAGHEEPDDFRDLLDLAVPYLPAEGASGEMIVNIGKAVYFARKGLDGVIDISPFTCMNGIICEAIYPRVSRDNGGIPIRNFYFDGTQSDLERDVGIFLELARNYRNRKTWLGPGETAFAVRSGFTSANSC
jgi:predicted nucleotide-binding protein (sugar kinase/HSP70/actin superfamily)